ncbi:MAG: hypothetical protein K0S38_441 [Candidatus Paceibacter sp.]|jgi:hypothetical protein|nr:hypothetical protein [Candidatus Paceibacter sp.]
MKSFQFVIVKWLPFAIIATTMAALVYIAAQQSFRMNANDPQINLAEDGATLLAQGQPPEIFGTNANTDMARSLVPFLLIYDDTGKVVSGTASLNGKIPTPPIGVFDEARRIGEHRLTWQPAPGVRIASVIVHYDGAKPGFILAGRSLREVEKRINIIMFYVFIAWVVALGTSLILVAFEHRPKDA